MCAPMAVTAGVQLGVAAYQIYSQRQAANASAQQSMQNAMLAEQQAFDAQARSAGGEFRNEARAINARVMAATAANNIDTGSFNPFEVDGLANAERDEMRLRAAGAREAWGFKQEARQHRTQAYNTRRAGLLGSIGTGLGALAGAIG